jgi:hypothetical protein
MKVRICWASLLTLTLMHCGAPDVERIKPMARPLPREAGIDVAQCATLTAKLTTLYQQSPNGKGETVVADNVAMIQRDCRRDPGMVVPCVRKAVSAADVTRQCTIPIDDQGSEGTVLFGGTP